MTGLCGCSDCKQFSWCPLLEYFPWALTIAARTMQLQENWVVEVLILISIINTNKKNPTLRDLLFLLCYWIFRFHICQSFAIQVRLRLLAFFSELQWHLGALKGTLNHSLEDDLVTSFLYSFLYLPSASICFVSKYMWVSIGCMWFSKRKSTSFGFRCFLCSQGKNRLLPLWENPTWESLEMIKVIWPHGCKQCLSQMACRLIEPLGSKCVIIICLK